MTTDRNDIEALAREISDFKPSDGWTRDDLIVMTPENLQEFASRLTAPAVPGGWKLVPVIPTDEMVQAANDARDERIKQRAAASGGLVIGGASASYTHHDTYRAMLAAAPAPDAINSYSKNSNNCIDGGVPTCARKGTDRRCLAPNCKCSDAMDGGRSAFDMIEEQEASAKKRAIGDQIKALADAMYRTANNFDMHRKQLPAEFEDWADETSKWLRDSVYLARRLASAADHSVDANKMVQQPSATAAGEGVSDA